jgi:phage-related protein
MDARGGTITWYLTANDADFNAAMTRTRSEARRTGRAVDRDFGKGMKSARLSLEDFRRDLGRSAQLFRDFQIALRGFQMTSLIIGVTTAGGAIVELVGALTAALGTLYTIPAFIGTAAGALATLKTATYGVGDAFKAVAEGDAKKLAEAMKKLSPNAQEFVTSFGKINEAFIPIRKAVQDAVFEGLGKQIEQVAKVSLPTIRTGMLQVAHGLNFMAKEAASVMKEPFFQGMLARSFALAEENALILTDAIRPLAKAFAALVEIGAPYTTMLSEWIVMQTELLAGWLGTAEGQKTVTDAINLGIDALQKLGTLIGSISKLFLALFRVSNQEGLSLIDTLIDIIDKTTAWVESAKGQELLTALFQATNTIFKELAETAGEFIVAILEIVKAYNDLDGPLKDIITHMIVWSAITSPIITYVSSLAASWRLVFFGLREVWQMAGLVIARLVGVKTGLTGIEIAQSSLSSFDKLKLAAGGVEQIFSRLGLFLKGAFNSAIITVYTTFLRLSTGGGIVAGILNGIAVAARVAWAAITGPVGLVILAITALVAVFVWLYNNVEPVRNVMDAVWAGIVSGAKAAAGWFTSTLVPMFESAWEGIKAGAQAVADFFGTVWGGITTAVGAVVNVFTTIGTVIAGVVVGAFNVLSAIITTVITVLTPLWQILGLIGAVFIGLGQIIWTIVSTAFTVLWTIFSTLVQIIGVIFYGTLLKIGEAITWVFNNAVTIITAAFTIIQMVFTTIWNGIVAFFTPILTAIGKVVSTVFNAIKNVVVTVFNAVSGFIRTVWNGIWGFLSPILARIASIFSTVFNAVAATVNRVFNLIKTYIINPISAVVSYVGATIGKIATFIGNAVTNAYNKVAGFVGRFTSAGKDLINGIVNGIKNGAHAVTDFIKNVCSDALGAVKNFFGIHSPSTVMAKMFGYVMAGAEKGIGDHQNALVSAAESAASGVMGAFSTMSASVAGMDTDFSVNGTASGAYGLSLAPGAIDSPDTIGTGATGAIIYQTNEVHTDLDMDQVNRNLTWELGKL